MTAPIYRAKKIDSDEYIEGYLFKIWQEYFICWGTTNGMPNQEKVDCSTLAIQLPERNFFISLDAKTGKGGDKISDDEVLIWNGEMMNCSILSLYPDGSINDYQIDLDNSVFDEIEVIGIQK